MEPGSPSRAALTEATTPAGPAAPTADDATTVTAAPVAVAVAPASSRPVATRRMCKALLVGQRRGGDVCPNYAGGGAFSHFCHRHTSRKRVLPETDTCSVCYEDLPIEYTLSCCGKFCCRDCLTKHQRAGGTGCPNCRAPIGFALDSVDYQWLNLKYHATRATKRVRDAEYIRSPDTLSAHMLALMQTQKAQALEQAKRDYEETVHDIEELFTNNSAFWINNHIGTRDKAWDLAQELKHTVSNLAILRSSRHPNQYMAQAGIEMVHDINNIFDEYFESPDLFGVLDDEDEAEEDEGTDADSGASAAGSSARTSSAPLAAPAAAAPMREGQAQGIVEQIIRQMAMAQPQGPRRRIQAMLMGSDTASEASNGTDSAFGDGDESEAETAETAESDSSSQWEDYASATSGSAESGSESGDGEA